MEYVKLGLLLFCLANAGVKFTNALCPIGVAVYGPEDSITDDKQSGHIVAVYKNGAGADFNTALIDVASAEYFDGIIFKEGTGGETQSLIVRTKANISELRDGKDDRPVITPFVSVQCVDGSVTANPIAWTYTVHDTNNKAPSFPEEIPTINADIKGWAAETVYGTINITDLDRTKEFAAIDSITVTSDTDPVPVVASLEPIGDKHPWVTPLSIKLVDGNVKLGNHTVTLVATNGLHKTETKFTIEVTKSSASALVGTFFTVTLLSLITSKIKNY